MAEIFHFFGATGDASAGLLIALIVEPLLNLIGFVTFLLVAFWHYRKTKSRGGLIVFSALLLSAISSLLIEHLAADLDDVNYGLVEVSARILEASLFIFMVYGFYLVCRNSQENVNSK